MKKAEVFVHGEKAGILVEVEKGKKYNFSYHDDYTGEPVSLSMPVGNKSYEYEQFPPFFDGLLPEGIQLESLLRKQKIDRTDYFSQLITVGDDMVGSVTVKELK